MQTALYTLIWKPRCKQTTAWEKSNHITKDTKEVYDKTKKQQRKNNPIHQIQAKAFFKSIQHITDSSLEQTFTPELGPMNTIVVPGSNLWSQCQIALWLLPQQNIRGPTEPCHYSGVPSNTESAQ